VRWAGRVAHTTVIINSYKIFVGEPDRKKPLGRSRILKSKGERMWMDYYGTE